jgi:hypothetical protein
VEENHQIPLQVVFAEPDKQPRNVIDSIAMEFQVNDFGKVSIEYRPLVVYQTILKESVF